MSFLGKPPPGAARKQAVYAIHGPDAFTELAVLDELAGPSAMRQLPILPALARKAQESQAVAQGSQHDSQAVNESRAQAKETAERFRLNKEQAKALAATAPWFRSCKAQVGGKPYKQGPRGATWALAVFMTRILRAAQPCSCRTLLLSSLESVFQNSTAVSCMPAKTILAPGGLSRKGRHCASGRKR